MIDTAKRVLLFFSRHPLLVFFIGAFLLSVVAVIIISDDNNQSGEDPQDIAKAEPVPKKRPYGGDIFKSEKGKAFLKRNQGKASPSYDNNPEKKAEETERIEERPALQLLPHYESGIAIDIVNVAPDGTPVVEVVRPELASEKVAQQIWEGFIKRSSDSEDNYIVIHREG